VIVQIGHLMINLQHVIEIDLFADWAKELFVTNKQDYEINECVRITTSEISGSDEGFGNKKHFFFNEVALDVRFWFLNGPFIEGEFQKVSVNTVQPYTDFLSSNPRPKSEVDDLEQAMKGDLDIPF
jgi:hypothetical protein